tara:strand:- start:7912 stop:8634 length:723 start_codon:yes stop_codon:yes gene_type:complete
MKTVKLTDFFDKVGYDWEKDKEELNVICRLTKTRPDNERVQGQFSHGQEQPFFIKALAEHIKAESFFEIGTGRGTACYAVALNDDMKEVRTFDIVPHEKKKHEAIDYKPAFVSNADLYEMMPYKQKEKITFDMRYNIKDLLETHQNKFDLCFIDGNHSDPRVILEDFYLCHKLLKQDGVIIFDDYHPNKHAVKKVVDATLASEKFNYNGFLVTAHGHLFEDKGVAEDYGMVVYSERDLGF